MKGPRLRPVCAERARLSTVPYSTVLDPNKVNTQQSHHAGVLEITTADVSGHWAAVDRSSSIDDPMPAEVPPAVAREVNASDFELHPS